MRQAESPVEGPYVPPAQEEQALEPADAYVPNAQDAHTPSEVAADALPNFPAGQGAGAERPVELQ